MNPDQRENLTLLSSGALCEPLREKTDGDGVSQMKPEDFVVAGVRNAPNAPLPSLTWN